MPLQPPLGPSATSARGNSLEQAASATTDTLVIGSSAATVAPAAPLIQKKESGAAKVQADKKKIDARKKSLKRL